MSTRVSRSAQASWQGTLPDGGGEIALDSGAFTGPFTLKARVEDVQKATNPEELIAAASAGCFTMSLASMLEERGTPVSDLRTTARVRLEQQEQGFRITRIALTTIGEVSDIDEAEFQALAEEAKRTCPVSLALSGTEITLKASLAGA